MLAFIAHQLGHTVNALEGIEIDNALQFEMDGILQSITVVSDNTGQEWWII